MHDDELAQQAKRYVDGALESRRRLGYRSAVSDQDYAAAVARATKAFRELAEVDVSSASQSERAA
jgi:hypothetical protein